MGAAQLFSGTWETTIFYNGTEVKVSSPIPSTSRLLPGVSQAVRLAAATPEPMALEEPRRAGGSPRRHYPPEPTALEEPWRDEAIVCWQVLRTLKTW